MLLISTERKLQFYNEFMQNSNVAVLVTDVDRKNIFVNKHSCELFGYSEEELLGVSAEIFHISKESYDRFGELVLASVLRGEKVAIDYQWKKKDGSVFWGHISGFVKKNSQEVLWTLFDITDRIEVREVLQSNELQAHIIDQMHDAVVMMDLDGNVLSWNKGATNLVGYSAQEILGKNISLICKTKEKSYVNNTLIKLQNNKTIVKERTIIKKDGSEIDLLISSSFLYDKTGKATSIIAYGQDITDIKEAQKKVLQADMFYALVQNAFIAIYVIQNNKFIYTNKKFQDIFGYKPEEMKDRTISDLIYTEDIAIVQQNLKQRTAKLGLGLEYTFRGVKKSGELFDAHVYGSSLVLENNEKAIIGMLTDDTKINLAKKQLEVLANKDTLTELYNRNFFNEHLKNTIENAKQNNQKLALILFDIDNFKRVNDSLGHNAGDKIIQETANKILKLLRDSDKFFRIGGDEFTIIIEDYKEKRNIEKLMQRIKTVMNQSIEIEHISFHISLSIGVSLYPQDAQDAQTLQKLADIAMYDAKRKGKDNYVFYSKDNGQYLLKAKLEDEIYKAYENNEFMFYLQPQISTQEQKLLSAEALIRWKHSTRGVVEPYYFLDLAEEVGLLYKLDLFIIEEALAFIREHKDIISRDFTISVNISNALFFHQSFLKKVNYMKQKYKDEIFHIQLELTENIAMDNQEYSKKMILSLKELGFSISIDDFGTGYSSLSHLKMLNVDELKIDKSFIDDIVSEDIDYSLVKAIIDMGKALNLVTVAEGVEKKEQYKILQDLGCDIIQGFYFSKPLSIKDFIEQYLA
jgi:diguanylate cyclase (GGDEF)-like protein/PAS domain S-box-containing protein